MKSIHKTYVFNSPIDKVWDAFVNPKTIDSWGGGKAEMSEKEGFEFSLWDGTIFGKNTKVHKNKLLEQDWYSGDKWPEPSNLIFKFSSKDDITTVEMIHLNIPDDEADSINEGWDTYYLGPMKELLEK